MSVKSMGPYAFPSRSRQELYGDDQLVSVCWRNNRFLCSAAMFRAPKAMTWAEFRVAMMDPWAASDPDFDPAGPTDWTVDGAPLTPRDDQTLEQLGIGHKSLLAFTS